MTFKTPHVDCLRRLAVTSAALPRNSLVNSNKHVPIIKHCAPLVIHCDARTCQMTGEAFGGEARVWRATEDQQTHDWLPFHVSHLSSRSFMPRPPPPPGEADPLLFHWADLEPNSSSQVCWLRAGSLRCIRPHHSWCRRPLSSHKQLWTVFLCESEHVLRFNGVIFIFNLGPGQWSLTKDKKIKSNQIYSVN